MSGAGPVEPGCPHGGGGSPLSGAASRGGGASGGRRGVGLADGQGIGLDAAAPARGGKAAGRVRPGHRRPPQHVQGSKGELTLTKA